MNIQGSHFSSDMPHKVRLLFALKKAVSQRAPEFEDLYQKVSLQFLGLAVAPLPDSFSAVFKPIYTISVNLQDAHEFLTSMLEQMRCLAPQLRMLAARMDRTFNCPVEAHFAFKMQNGRMCTR